MPKNAFYFLLYYWCIVISEPLAMKQVQHELNVTVGDIFVYALLFVYFMKPIHGLLCILYTEE